MLTETRGYRNRFAITSLTLKTHEKKSVTQGFRVRESYAGLCRQLKASVRRAKDETTTGGWGEGGLTHATH